MMTNTTNTTETLREMKRAEVGTLPTYSRLVVLAKSWGLRDTDSLEEATIDDLRTVGFSPSEAEAIMFIMSQDVMGQAATSAENVSRFLNYCV